MNRNNGLQEHSFAFPVSNDLNMYYCGKREKSYNHEYGPMIRTHFLLVFIREGQATLYGKKHDLRLNANDLLVMFPGERIHYRTDRDVPWSISWVGVYGTLVWDFLGRLGISQDEPVLHVSNSEETAEILEQLFNVSKDNTISAKTHCISLIYDFFTALFKNTSAAADFDPIEEALHMIQYNFDKKITVASVAAALFLNPSYFARLFRSKTGLSPKEYIDRERIRKACYILTTGSAPICEVAASVGINDQMYFARLFKKKTGMTPTEYRAKSRPNE